MLLQCLACDDYWRQDKARPRYSWLSHTFDVKTSQFVGEFHTKGIHKSYSLAGIQGSGRSGSPVWTMMYHQRKFGIMVSDLPRVTHSNVEKIVNLQRLFLMLTHITCMHVARFET